MKRPAPPDIPSEIRNGQFLPGQKKRGRGGRPSKYSEELADKICSRMISGETLTKILQDKGMPDKISIWRWRNKYPEFRAAYEKARELMADALADQVLMIADDSSSDKVIDRDGKARTDWEVVGRSRLRCDMRRWYAAKIAPKKYSEKAAVEVSDPGGAPVGTGAAAMAGAPLEERAKALAVLIAKWKAAAAG